MVLSRWTSSFDGTAPIRLSRPKVNLSGQSLTKIQIPGNESRSARNKRIRREKEAAGAASANATTDVHQSDKAAADVAEATDDKYERNIVFVGQLPYNCTKTDIANKFADNIGCSTSDLNIRMLTDKKTKKFRCVFNFLQFVLFVVSFCFVYIIVLLFLL